jgi:hypothetical protein
MFRNLFFILSKLGNDALSFLFSFVKIKNKYLSILFSLSILFLIVFLTKDTEFSIFNPELSTENVSLWVTIVLAILSNHNDTKKPE